MKKIVLGFVVLFSLLCNKAYPEMEVGSWVQEVEVFPGFIEFQSEKWATDSKSYVNGGITFTYPVGHFIETPRVLVSVKSNSYSSGRIIAPEVTSNSATSSTVRVNVATLLALGEAATNSVVVSILAIGEGVAEE